MNDAPFDVVVVGSGPAGVSTCWPMLAAGMRVLLVEGGGSPSISAPKAETLKGLRADQAEATNWLIDKHAYWREKSASSPKLRIPTVRPWLTSYSDVYPVRQIGFSLHGFLAAGGLSRAWGAGACCFTDGDLGGSPVTLAELRPSYRAVAARIGISGTDDDDIADWLGPDLPLQPPLPLHGGADLLLRRYRERRGALNTLGLRLGRVRHAVLSEDLAARQACSLSNLCLWGCRRSAIYNAALELADLARHPLFRVEYDTLVKAVERQEETGRYMLRVLDRRSGEHRSIATARVVLAAGTLGSTILACRAMKLGRARLRLLNTPVMAFALLQPRRIGINAAESGFAMGQLAFSLDLPGVPQDDPLYGALYATDGIPASELMGHLPLSRPAAVAVARRLWPAMLLGSCFFPGELSDNSLTFDGDAMTDILLKGGVTPAFNGLAAAARRRLARAAFRMGAVLLPGSAIVAEQGADMHYAGTMPMREQPGPTDTDRLGQPAAMPGMHLVDGSVLPRLPAKAHTLTIMANADRIGQAIAAAWRSASD